MDAVEALRNSIKPAGLGKLSGKTAVVTGASSGIGRAISLAYAREGASLVNADLRPEPSSRGPSKESIPTHELITAAGGTSSYHHLDATKPASFTALLGYVRDEYGRLDVMVNNAGLALGREQGADCPIWESTEESWARTMDINAGGVFWGTRAAAGVMVAQEPGPSGDRGWIVNMASIYGVVASETLAAYVASKHACMGITKSAALDCAPFNVHVNAICPGFVKSALAPHIWENKDMTDFVSQRHPLRGAGSPEDVAPAAVFLASEDARWVTGAGITVDGGYTAQ